MKGKDHTHAHTHTFYEPCMGGKSIKKSTILNYYIKHFIKHTNAINFLLLDDGNIKNTSQGQCIK